MTAPRRGTRFGAIAARVLRVKANPPAEWMVALAEGSDEGFFGPGSAVWAVHGSLPTMAAGIRALLLQTLHPGAMAGVHDHSRYREDTMGRLDGTVRWVLTTSFGDREAATAVSAFVSRLHTRVTGSYVDARGDERGYSANDPELLSWVHVAFTEAFLGAHELWGGAIPGGGDRYVAEWARSGTLMGVAHPPTTVAELRAQLAAFTREAKPDERVAEAVRFLRRPPLPKELRFAYRLLFAGATASLPRSYRRLLGLRRPLWPAITVTGLFLKLVTAMLGTQIPSERFARQRLARLSETSVS
jgi:uncharacterized protein (DUF2236 family)